MKKWAASLTAAVLGFLWLCGPASAEWLWTHGHSGHPEYKDRIINPNHYELGWGLDFYQKPNLDNWVHFAVPTKYGDNWGVRYIRLKFYTNDEEARLTQIDIYNGSTKVKTFTPPDPYSWCVGWKDIQLDLGAKMSFTRGLGISVHLVAGGVGGSYRFIFSAAGAQFQQ